MSNKWNDVLMWDIEVFPNYAFLVWGSNLKRDELHYIDLLDLEKLEEFIDDPRYKFSWNGYKYDNIVLDAVIKQLKDPEGCTYNDIKILNDDIINGSKTPERYNVNDNWAFKDLPRMLELYDKTKGIVTGLKKIASSIGSVLMDSPYDFNKILTEEEQKNVIKYCENDVKVMFDAWDYYKSDIDSKIFLCDKYELKNPYKTSANLSKGIFEKFLIQTNDPKINNYNDDECFDNIKWHPAIDVSSENYELFMKAKGKNKTLYIGDHEITTGSGGLHSVIDNVICEENLVDVDVASFYPAIILSTKIKPPQLNDDFFDMLESVRSDRLKAKAEGDKVRANAYKIVINSIYGMFGENHGSREDPKPGQFYDKTSLLSVTCNGQLGLIDLAEKLSKYAKLISMNTDGITCKIKDEEGVNSVIEDWEKRYDFQLEKTEYKKYYAKDVSNYLTITNDDHVKAKGSYGDTAGGIKACSEAFQYFAKIGISQENEDSVYAFLKAQPIENFKKYISYYCDIEKHKKKGDFYFVKEGRTLYNVDKLGKRSICGRSVSEDSTDLDMSVYWAQILQYASIFYDNREFLKSWGYGPRLVNSNPVTKTGVINFKAGIKGVKPTDPTTWRCQRYSEGCLVVCHPETKIICFDIDVPEDLTPEDKELFDRLISEGGFVIRSSHPTKFSMLFKVRPDQLNVGRKRLKDGYEVLYGCFKKIYGRHSIEKGDYYTRSGEIKDLPDELYKKFKKKYKKKESKKSVVLTGSLVDKLTAFGFEDVIEKGEFYHATHKGYIEDYLTTHDVDPTPIAIYPKEHDKIVLHTFHSSSADYVQKLQNEFNETVKETKKKDSSKTITEVSVNEEDGEILKLLKTSKGLFAYEAGTGAGKSYNTAVYAHQRQLMGFSTIIAVPTKQMIYEYVSTLKDLGVNEGLIKILDSEHRTTFKCEEGDIVIMVHTYLTRKENDKYVYSIIKNLQVLKDVTLCIDEAHLFVLNLNISLTLNAAYKPLNKISGTYTPFNSCCRSVDNCIKNSDIKRYDVPISITKKGLVINPFNLNNSEQFDLSDVIDDMKIVKIKNYDDFGLRVYLLEDTKRVSNMRMELDDFYRKPSSENNYDSKEDYEKDIKSKVVDMIQWTRLSMIHENYIIIQELDEDKSVINEQIIDSTSNFEEALETLKNKNFREKCSYTDIFSKNFLGVDFLPIQHLLMLQQQLGWKVCMCSATTSIQLSEVYKYLGIKPTIIEERFDKNILDKITVIDIDYGDKFAKNDIYPPRDEHLNIYDWFSESVCFLSTKNKFNNMNKDAFSRDKMSMYNEGALNITHNGLYDPNNKIIMSYSKASIGTGSNLYEQKSVIINEEHRVNPAGIPQPLYQLDKSIVELIEIEGSIIMRQNVGRIMRTKDIREKFVILNNTTLPDHIFYSSCKELKRIKIYYDSPLSSKSNYELFEIINLIVKGRRFPREINLSNSKFNIMKIGNLIINENQNVLKSIFKTTKELELFRSWKPVENEERFEFPQDCKEVFWKFCLYLYHYNINNYIDDSKEELNKMINICKRRATKNKESQKSLTSLLKDTVNYSNEKEI